MPVEGRLRMATYLHPGLPMELFQTYQYYLEEILGMSSTMLVESRWSGPPHHLPDPFVNDELDVAFTCSTSFMRYLDSKNPHVELLPAGVVNFHPKSELRPVYFADVIVHKDKMYNYKEFLDLKGHKWAYNDDDSITGNICILAELRRLGFNASFFGHVIKSGSHHNSIDMVINQTIDAASIDSSVLYHYLRSHPEYKNKLHTLCSLGPLPIQPILVNARLPAETKQKMVDGLLKMNTIPQWKEKLDACHVWGFKPTNVSLYDDEKALQAVVKDLSMNAIYY